MKNVVSISQRDELLEAATRWVLRIDEGALSASEKAALGGWLAEDTRHREVLLEVAAVWDKTDALAQLADLFPHDAATHWVSRGPLHRRWALSLATAAGLAVVVLSSLFFLKTTASARCQLPPLRMRQPSAGGRQCCCRTVARS